MDYLDKIIQKEMKGSIIIVFVFLCGVAMGILNIFPSVVSDSLFSTIVLYVLMFLVGVCIGSENKIKSIIKNVTFHSLLIPFGTIIGTLVFSAIAAIIMDSISLFDCLVAFWRWFPRPRNCRDKNTLLQPHSYLSCWH